MESNCVIDRELLKQQRKERKKLKKQAIREEKLTQKTINNENHDDLHKKGVGCNRHVKSNIAIQATLESLQKANKSLKKVENKKNEVIKKTYSGNPLDSSQPERFRGKYKMETENHKIKHNKLKTEILKCEDLKDTSKIYHCNSINIITDELNNAVEIYIKKLVHLQDKAYFKSSDKIKFKKRYICGFHELKKKLIVGKIKFFIFAINIRTYAPIYSLICDISSFAKENSIQFVFALKRSKLGSLCHINRPVSCLGVLNHDGAEEEFKNVIENICQSSSEDVEEKKEDEEVLEKCKKLSINN
ncbi:selenocysteine insertion sequence-binding protein 2-like [Onthophagus taurus]|uniref:selenocysteine insertion sequence-binding protein 2-like n=1 Tax=Onthophagus taurus TaxID=166361 RepID=UPI0039BEA423